MKLMKRQSSTSDFGSRNAQDSRTQKDGKHMKTHRSAVLWWHRNVPFEFISKEKMKTQRNEKLQSPDIAFPLIAPRSPLSCKDNHGLGTLDSPGTCTVSS
jgi:hypothetical protein